MRTLLLDIGGTILTRSIPGPKQRVIDVLREFTNISRQESLEAADITLTAGSRDAAVEQLTRRFDLSPNIAGAIEAALLKPEGDAHFIPSALKFIAACKKKNIKIIYTTNAVAWAPELPLEIMTNAEYISSASVGISKRDPQFWRTVLDVYGLDAQTCLSVGDSIENDVRPAQQVGIAGIRVGRNGWAIDSVAITLSNAEDALSGQDGFIVGPVERVAEYNVVECGHLAEWVVAKTRSRAVINTNSARIHGEVVRTADERSALFVTNSSLPDSVFGWVQFARDKRITHIPPQIEKRVAAEGRTFEGLAGHEQRHYLSLLIEATSEAILEERLKAIIDLLPARNSNH